MLFGLLAVIAVVFALANRGKVTVNLWPLPIDDVTLPLYFAILGAMALGLVLGVAAAWPARERMRRRARVGERRAATAERATTAERKAEAGAPEPARTVSAPVTGRPTGWRPGMDDD
jgi:uncharacterized integral membrane protein